MFNPDLTSMYAHEIQRDRLKEACARALVDSGAGEPRRTLRGLLAPLRRHLTRPMTISAVAPAAMSAAGKAQG